MPVCCDPSDYGGVFDEREARHSLRRFHKRGLDSTAGPMIGALARRGLHGATVTEAGAGIGSAQVALLASGAERGVAYELSPGYELVAHELLADHGMTDRVEWRTADFVTASGHETSDVVFLNRVVCCYPDMPAMVDRASQGAGRFLAMSYPRQRLLVRIGTRGVNALLWLRRTTFRAFLHDPKAIGQRITGAGFTEVESGRTAVWEWKVWERKRD
jgi:magnesium-protoporphyrin O-methyltransferase